MYTSHIGKRFVQIVNEREKSQLDAKMFFEERIFPLFYANPKPLMWVHNSPFALLKNQSAKKKEPITPELCIEAKNTLMANIEAMHISGSTAVGYPAKEDDGTTSGQVSSISLPLLPEDLYSSWIGAGLGIGISDGLTIMFDKPNILLALAEGWLLYRDYVNQTNGIDNKIDTWNGIWLKHRFNEYFNPALPRAGGFRPVGSDGKMERPDWTDIIFALAEQFPKETLTGYIYSFGQMNKTVGFVRFALPEVGRFKQHLFGNLSPEQRERVKALYKTQYGVSAAIERFSVLGLQALEPKDLRKFMRENNAASTLKNDDKSQLTYNIYIAWISAMLNNQQLLELAQEAAQTLHAYTSGNKNAKKDRDNLVNELLGSANRKRFIDALTDIVNDDASIAPVSDKLVHALMTDIPLDNVPLFVTLVRFKYALPQVKN